MSTQAIPAAHDAAGWPALPPSWADLAFFQSDWPQLRHRLDQESGWQPARADVFRALQLTPRERVRVVILGQDPYHTLGRATGLAFSFPQGEAPRDSLRNILTEVETDLGALRPSGDLSAWAEQGVLLLNTALSVPVGQANGHKNYGWAPLIREIIASVSADGPRAFVLWGAPAQKLCADVSEERHLLLRSPHPSPLSAYRGFFGSKPFSRINHWLAAQGETEIDWLR